MNILFVATELAPHAKVGGLADVMAALPQALARAGHGVSLAVPLHRSLKKSGEFRPTDLVMEIVVAGKSRPTRVWEGQRGEVALWGIERDEFFDRAHPYGDGAGEYPDSLERFNFLARASVELARYIEPTPDILHANDWHAALVPGHCRALGLPMKSVFTIHNLKYQGEFPAENFSSLDLPPGMYSPEGFEFYGRLNLMKGAILLSDAVTTVSPTYAKEIQGEAQGFGLHEVLQGNTDKLTGILNGIDEESWNPSADTALKTPYRRGALRGREECRAALEIELGLEPANGRPIFGMVTRMAAEKGVDLALANALHLIRSRARLVILGTGDKRLEEAALQLAQKYPKQVVLRREHNEGLARRIFAGADFFLMPSASEPCGLTQMYAMRYGAIPVVGDTGGLHDTVQEWDGKAKKGTGFLFRPHTEAALRGAMDRALALWDEPAIMKVARQNGMKKEWGWGSAVPAYEKVYRSVLA
ncbi:MAG: glycogen synthase GlgA [Verrucomicrobia bacterium]|nr:glycogen synthase GlgA [Verrucomicrobiota bacterium]